MRRTDRSWASRPWSGRRSPQDLSGGGGGGGGGSGGGGGGVSGCGRLDMDTLQQGAGIAFEVRGVFSGGGGGGGCGSGGSGEGFS